MTPTESVRLIPQDMQPGMLESYPLDDEKTTIGRHPSNTIVLPLDSISRFHARIDRRGDFYILQDLNSSNGSMVNEEAITQLAIHDGDIVTFGNVEFRFVNNNTVERSSRQSSEIGKSIVDFDDDPNEMPSGEQTLLRAEDVTDKAKSSVISTAADKKADKATLFKLNQRLSALYRLSELLRELDVDREEFVLQRILDVLFLSVNADRGVILTRFHRDAKELDVIAVKYRDEPIVPEKVKVSRTILNKVVTEKVAVLSRDAQADDRFDASESIIMSEIRSTICAPMVVGDEVLGAIHIDSKSHTKSFDQDDLEFVTIIATETAVALAHMRMQKEAIHRQRLAAVGETVAGISHNVKNILLLSQGGAELLTRALDKGDMEGANDSWQVVSRGIDKIGKLVRDMLEFSSNKKPDLEEVDVNEMICSIAEEIEDELVAKGITLELDLDEDLAKRKFDELGLQRTLMNLIVNGMEAIQHSDGQIVVTTAQDAEKVYIITIQDNGSGIPQEKLEKIFFPFFTTKGSAGTGLGLPMCKKAIEDMSGSITCESEENVGTRFVIELPPPVESETE